MGDITEIEKVHKRAMKLIINFKNVIHRQASKASYSKIQKTTERYDRSF